MFASSAIAGLNHLLADAPWARERLAPFAGRTAIFVLKPLELGLGIDKDGYFSDAANRTYPLSCPWPPCPKPWGARMR